MSEADFDAARYWRDRHRQLPGLRATGTSGAPMQWQRWLYRGKERVFKSVLAAAGFGVAGTRVLDFGCGTGYFEDFWESLGARTTAGIDLFPELVDPLRKAHPSRLYAAGDLVEHPHLLLEMGEFELVTAIDVLYHIVEDARLERTLSALASSLARDGVFLFTDALDRGEPAPHVRFRDAYDWKRHLTRAGLEIVRTAPVFVFNNLPGPFARLAPGVVGRTAYFLDGLFASPLSRWANNSVVLCRHAG